MEQAIAILRVAKQNAVNNAPIHQDAGDYAQAALCRKVVEDCTAALERLQSVDSKDAAG